MPCLFKGQSICFPSSVHLVVCLQDDKIKLKALHQPQPPAPGSEVGRVLMWGAECGWGGGCPLLGDSGLDLECHGEGGVTEAGDAASCSLWRPTAWWLEAGPSACAFP